eukprot:784655-Pelagomonas_calceolata.AAC.1
MKNNYGRYRAAQVSKPRYPVGGAGILMHPDNMIWDLGAAWLTKPNCSCGWFQLDDGSSDFNNFYCDEFCNSSLNVLCTASTTRSLARCAGATRSRIPGEWVGSTQQSPRRMHAAIVVQNAHSNNACSDAHSNARSDAAL